MDLGDKGGEVQDAVGRRNAHMTLAQAARSAALLAAGLSLPPMAIWYVGEFVQARDTFAAYGLWFAAVIGSLTFGGWLVRRAVSPSLRPWLIAAYVIVAVPVGSWCLIWSGCVVGGNCL